MLNVIVRKCREKKYPIRSIKINVFNYMYIHMYKYMSIYVFIYK